MPHVDIGGREVVQALGVSPVIVVADEAFDLSLEVAGQVVILEQDAVLQRLMPTFNLAPRLRMIGCTADVRVCDVLATWPSRPRYKKNRCRREKPRPVDDLGFFDHRLIKRKLQHFGDVFRLHGRAQLLRQLQNLLAHLVRDPVLGLARARTAIGSLVSQSRRYRSYQR